MRIVKTTGLFLFVAAFLAFNLSFFWADYVLTPQTVEQQISEEGRRTIFVEEASSLFNEEVDGVFDFVSQLENAFNKANDRIIRTYTITESEIEKVWDASKNKFTFNDIDEIFAGTTEVDLFKRNAFREYGGSLEGKEVTREELQHVINTIHQYGIVDKVGFDRYEVNDLKYSITKASTKSPIRNNAIIFLLLTIGLCVVGASLYILPKLTLQPGIKNNGVFFNPMKNTGWLGVLTGTWLIVFYVLLYFYPEYMTTWIMLVDPVSESLNGHEAGRFFLYGFIYTLCILVMGVRMIIHYRHNRYQIIRTISVMFFQTAFAFLLPEILIRLNKPYFDFKNIWPLDYDFFFGSELDKLIANGTLGIFMLGWGIALIVLAVPIFTYFYGKRWYCSWVCGCGGLAETLGDPYRQLSNKSVTAWKVERWMIHGVLVFAVVMTAAVLYTYWSGSSWFFFVDSYQLRASYGFLIGAGFAGVVGTGFYPLMGNRVWCRFGCPLAAYLGLIQRFKSRFRITTNGGQCISCGNCSTYCEMGIDVRWYAQRGQNIIRSSCVGCGICAAVCPRGVLKLENKEEQSRFGKPVLIGNNNIKLIE